MIIHNLSMSPLQCRCIFILSFLLIQLVPIRADNIYFVSMQGSDAQVGTSWNTAFQTVQKALSVAQEGDEIWIAQGTYYPDEGPGQDNNATTATFNVGNGIKMIGGFSGTEAHLSDRPTPLLPTILSGDINQSQSFSGNSECVVSLNYSTDVLLEGLIVERGNASNLGGGLRGSFSGVIIRNCTFRNNRASHHGGAVAGQYMFGDFEDCHFIQNSAGKNGGAVHLDLFEGSIKGCRFDDNNTDDKGGALWVQNWSNGKVTNCRFDDNQADDYGAATYFSSCYNLKITQCVFYNNFGYWGGAISGESSSIDVINSTFVYNQASDGATFYMYGGGSHKFINCVFYDGFFGFVGDNISLDHCLLEGFVFSATTNDVIYGIPDFINPQEGDVRLNPCSMGVDEGRSVNGLPEFDFDGNPRAVDLLPGEGVVDMGAYEVGTPDQEPPVPVCLNPSVEISGNGTYELKEEDIYSDYFSSDNCGITNVSFSEQTYSCEDRGMVYNVTVTVNDAKGNEAACNAEVTVKESAAFPNGWTATNIGGQSAEADFIFNPCGANQQIEAPDEFEINSNAFNFGNNGDQIAFMGVELCGNGGIQAEIKSIAIGYAGIAIRESNAPGSKMTAIYSNLSSLLRRETRYETDGSKSISSAFTPFATRLRLVRQGDWVRGFYRTPNSSSWQLFHQVYLPMNQCVEMGLAVFTTDPNGQGSATFGRVNWLSSGGGNLSMPDLAIATGEQLPEPRLFPNPTGGPFTLSFGEALQAPATVVLRNPVGQALEQRVLQAGTVQTEWGLHNHPDGLYLLEIRREGQAPSLLRLIKTK
jgi:predicted outer membrane repeat protein